MLDLFNMIEYTLGKGPGPGATGAKPSNCRRRTVSIFVGRLPQPGELVAELLAVKHKA